MYKQVICVILATKRNFSKSVQFLCRFCSHSSVSVQRENQAGEFILGDADSYGLNFFCKLLEYLLPIARNRDFMKFIFFDYVKLLF